MKQAVSAACHMHKIKKKKKTQEDSVCLLFCLGSGILTVLSCALVRALGAQIRAQTCIQKFRLRNSSAGEDKRSRDQSCLPLPLCLEHFLLSKEEKGNGKAHSALIFI